MGDRSQAEIRSSWQGGPDVLVSIVCAAFNQSLYVRSALDSFLIQETTFPFEVVVHDDASTDGTSEIIKSYAARYPDIIKPVFQTENQFSKGGFKPSIYAAKFAKGKYIALCEGDDFWISRDKLQSQFESLESNPGVDFCFHPAILVQEGVVESKVSWTYEHERIIPLEELMFRRTGSFAPTASYMFRREVLVLLPAWFYSRAPVGDYFLERYGARRGGAIYINRPMSAYRTMVTNSWSDKAEKSIELYGKHVEAMLLCIDLMTEDFAGYESLLRMHAAKLTLAYSMRALVRGEDALFLQQIEVSRAAYKYLSKKQSLAYWLRHWPSLLKLSLKIVRLF